jgi:predicted RNA-binding protein with PUA-like domain
MPQYWILKTEPTDYSYQDLEADGRTVWDGVKNNLALKHLRTMKQGDRALVYHTGNVKALIGEAVIVSPPYPDPRAGDPRLVVVDIEPARQLGRPVPLAEIKAEPALAELGLVRMGRLSVVPASAAQWKQLKGMGRKA